MYILDRESIAWVNEHLSITKQYGQDWDIEVSEFARVEEFIEFYNLNRLLNTNIRRAIFALILSSYDDSLENGIKNTKLESEIVAIATNDADEMNDIIEYWCSGCDDDGYSIRPILLQSQ